MIAKRGCVPEDERNFSPESLERLKTASGHVLYLINEGYDLKQACTFVGNHFLLSERQRLAIMRSVATRDQLEGRRKKRVPFAELAGQAVWIDGFNTVITLEVMLSDSILFSCMDGTVRDLAALRGTYRIIDVTESAVRAMLDCLEEAQVGEVHILLDKLPRVHSAAALSAGKTGMADDSSWRNSVRFHALSVPNGCSEHDFHGVLAAVCGKCTLSVSVASGVYRVVPPLWEHIRKLRAAWIC